MEPNRSPVVADGVTLLLQACCTRAQVGPPNPLRDPRWAVLPRRPQASGLRSLAEAFADAEVDGEQLADMDEDEILAAENDAGKDEIVKFITEALDTRESRMEQRKAHVLNESKKGNHKDMGLTMDTVLGEQEERLAKEGPAKLMNFKKGKKSPRSAIAVHDRGELKKMSRKITRQKEKELAREAAAKAKAEFDLMNA